MLAKTLDIKEIDYLKNFYHTVTIDPTATGTLKLVYSHGIQIKGIEGADKSFTVVSWNKKA